MRRSRTLSFGLVEEVLAVPSVPVLRTYRVSDVTQVKLSDLRVRPRRLKEVEMPEAQYHGSHESLVVRSNTQTNSERKSDTSGTEDLSRSASVSDRIFRRFSLRSSRSEKAPDLEDNNDMYIEVTNEEEEERDTQHHRTSEIELEIRTPDKPPQGQPSEPPEKARVRFVSPMSSPAPATRGPVKKARRHWAMLM